MNELGSEKSPYLRQHQSNPIHWKPWSKKWLEKAHSENKLVFLSIGYATCHWCHVMERESFEDEQVASYFNDNFICIKVDREEHPDVDEIYMTTLHMMGQQGGWPLNMFLTPKRTPIFGGTYFPKENLLAAASQIVKAWEGASEKIEAQGEQITKILSEHFENIESGTSLSPLDMRRFAREFLGRHDTKYGGPLGAPKFPPYLGLMTLSQFYSRTGDVEAIQCIEETLDGILKGGIYDHLGGGFSRYAVDERWEIPHFEKMLYTNAFLVENLLDAYMHTQRDEFLRFLTETVDYVFRDLMVEDSAFASGEDADSEGEEGKFYAWTYQELETYLTTEEMDFLREHFEVSERGNFEKNTNVLNYNSSHWEPRFSEQFEKIQTKLFREREKRVRPLRDNKVLTSWNSLMISALTRAGATLKRKPWCEKASKALEFLLDKLTDEEDYILRRYCDGESKYRGTLEDYAFLAKACLDVAEFTRSYQYFDRAKAIAKDMKKHFWDTSAGGFYNTGVWEDILIARTKVFSDDAIPSGNAVALEVLIRLYEVYGEDWMKKDADKIITLAQPQLASTPLGFAFLLKAFDIKEHGISTISAPPDAYSQLENLQFENYPYVKVYLSRGDGQELPPILRGKSDLTLCRNQTCQPVSEALSSFSNRLKRPKPLTP